MKPMVCPGFFTNLLSHDDAVLKLALIDGRSSPHSPSHLKSEPKPGVISVHEASRVLGLTPATIRAWTGLRKIASVQDGVPARLCAAGSEPVSVLGTSGLLHVAGQRNSRGSSRLSINSLSIRAPWVHNLDSV